MYISIPIYTLLDNYAYVGYYILLHSNRERERETDRSLTTRDLKTLADLRVHDVQEGSVYLCGCQNHGPFLGPYYNAAPII